jgi:hypothetical protein
LTIFDLPTLDPTEAIELARTTIAGHPLLGRLYDDAPVNPHGAIPRIEHTE